METLSWMAALALLAAPASKAPTKPSPVHESVTPTKRPADIPAGDSPYSAFSAPNARRPKAARRPSARLRCADGKVLRGGTHACDSHGGVKH